VLAPADDSGDQGNVTTPVEQSTTLIDASLADLAGGGSAINVHESVEQVERYIACGEIAGPIVPGAGADEGAQLAVGLRELNGSGYAGVAVLQERDGQTQVSIYLVSGLTAGGAATPAATDAGNADAAAVQVDIVNFAYNPDPLTISVGQSVTWTNRDAAPHTATGRDRDALQSGTLKQGESYTATFDTPGTYEYFCEFHPNMKGTVIVE
jgi:plastocyanin